MVGSRHWTHWLLVAVAIVTVLSGIGQALLPDRTLAFMGLMISDDTVFLIRVLSLLVALFGGALLHSALTARFEHTVLLWVGLQKLIGAASMLLGMTNGLFASEVLLVAGFDFAAGLYVLWFSSWGRR